MTTGEAERIRAVYRDRDRLKKDQLYAWHRPDVLLNRYRVNTVASRLLRRAGFDDWDDKEALDVGCGSGVWLCRVIEWGGIPQRLHGVDLLPDRIEQAKKRAPQVDWRINEGNLPYPDGSMDIVSAHLVLSTVLDEDLRKKLAEDILRVMRPGGWLIIYDLRISHPANHATTGISLREMNRLFPGLHILTQTLTLAPPLSRFLTPKASAFAHILEACLPFLRTHRLCVLRKPS